MMPFLSRLFRVFGILALQCKNDQSYRLLTRAHPTLVLRGQFLSRTRAFGRMVRVYSALTFVKCVLFVILKCLTPHQHNSSTRRLHSRITREPYFLVEIGVILWFAKHVHFPGTPKWSWVSATIKNGATKRQIR